jgi:hypothetical protein
MKTAVWGLLTLALIGCRANVETKPIEKNVQANPIEELDFEEFKASDPEVGKLAKAFPTAKIEWSVAPSPITWSNLTVSDSNDSELFQIMAMAFIYRSSDLTQALLPAVQDSAKQWLASDRSVPIETTSNGYNISITGGKSESFLRLSIKKQ